VVLFCEGEGIAAAAALIEAGTDPSGLSLTRRPDVRMYYRAPNEAALCYKERYEEWGRRYNVRVITSTRDSFSDMFDDDETLMYEPDSTAAVLLCGGDEEAEAAAAAACAEAEISVVVRQSQEAEPTNYLLYGKPKD
jgi:NAD(P)H-flavin reductase